MIGRTENTAEALENIHVTHIQLKPVGKHSLAKDVIEIVTGVSSGAISIGGKITAGTIIYTHVETSGQKIANQIFWIGSLIATCIDWSLIPLGYLYKYLRNEDVPFNLENNRKWALASLTLILSIIGAAVAAAGRVLSFISSGLAILVGSFAVWKYFYDYKKTGNELDAALQNIATLTNEIEIDMYEINQLQDQIRFVMRSDHTNKNNINPLIVHLAATYHRYDGHIEQLKESYHLKNHLERQFIRQKSPVELVANIVKFALAAVVLTGTILSLNPVTAPIGMIMLATASLVSLIVILGKKAIQIVQKRVERDHEIKRNRHIEISLDTTAGLIRSLNAPHSVIVPRPAPISDQHDLVEEMQSTAHESAHLLAEDAEEIPMIQHSYFLKPH